MIISKMNIRSIPTFESRIHEFSQHMIEKNKLIFPYIWSLVDLFYLDEDNEEGKEQNIENTILNIVLKMDFLKKNNIVHAESTSKEETKNAFNNHLVSIQKQENSHSKSIYPTLNYNIYSSRRIAAKSTYNQYKYQSKYFELLKNAFSYQMRKSYNRLTKEYILNLNTNKVQNNLFNKKTTNIFRVVKAFNNLEYENNDVHHSNDKEIIINNNFNINKYRNELRKKYAVENKRTFKNRNEYAYIYKNNDFYDFDITKHIHQDPLIENDLYEGEQYNFIKNTSYNNYLNHSDFIDYINHVNHTNSKTYKHNYNYLSQIDLITNRNDFNKFLYSNYIKNFKSGMHKTLIKDQVSKSFINIVKNIFSSRVGFRKTEYRKNRNFLNDLHYNHYLYHMGFNKYLKTLKNKRYTIENKNFLLNESNKEDMYFDNIENIELIKYINKSEIINNKEDISNIYHRNTTGIIKNKRIKKNINSIKNNQLPFLEFISEYTFLKNIKYLLNKKSKEDHHQDYYMNHIQSIKDTPNVQIENIQSKNSKVINYRKNINTIENLNNLEEIYFKNILSILYKEYIKNENNNEKEYITFFNKHNFIDHIQENNLINTEFQKYIKNIGGIKPNYRMFIGLLKNSIGFEKLKQTVFTGQVEKAKDIEQFNRVQNVELNNFKDGKYLDYMNLTAFYKNIHKSIYDIENYSYKNNKKIFTSSNVINFKDYKIKKVKDINHRKSIYSLSKKSRNTIANFIVQKRQEQIRQAKMQQSINIYDIRQFHKFKKDNLLYDARSRNEVHFVNRLNNRNRTEITDVKFVDNFKRNDIIANHIKTRREKVINIKRSTDKIDIMNNEETSNQIAVNTVQTNRTNMFSNQLSNRMLNRAVSDRNNYFEKEIIIKHIYHNFNNQSSLPTTNERFFTYEKRSEIVHRENKREKESPDVKVETINKPIKSNIEVDTSHKEINESQIHFIMNKVYEKLEKKLKFEKQRRGL